MNRNLSMEKEKSIQDHVSRGEKTRQIWGVKNMWITAAENTREQGREEY